MCKKEVGKTKYPNVRLTNIEINNFRRLRQISTSIDDKTTIFVGSNNSGKTSVLTAIRKFLAESPAFGAFDLSLNEWPVLRQLGKEWESLDETPESSGGNNINWEQHLEKFLTCMPTLDLWFDVQLGAYHIARPFLPSLQWSGGPIGVRVRLEPASTIEELQKLAWRFREARHPVRAYDTSSQAWPMDILDYWLRYPNDLSRIMVYKLDPAKGPMATPSPNAPQDLPLSANSIDRSCLSKLVRVDFIAAQRGLGSEEADSRPGSDPHRVGLFSNQVLKFARRNLGDTGHSPSQHPDLIAAVTKAQDDLDSQIRLALDPTIKDVRKLGYPGLHDPQEIHFRTRIQTADLLDHSTAVQYRLADQLNDTYFPEHAIGLGYQNLQSLSYQLVSFRESRLNPDKGAPSAVHLVLLEEPEAHLHVQVQRVFSKRSLELITSDKPEHEHLSSQLLISTHASHLAHSESFTHLRYVRRLAPQIKGTMPSSEVVNLADVFGSDIVTRSFAERYFQVQHTDLLFADAAIFVEGTAERMLVPFFIERDFHDLRSRYLSILDVGGSHAHRLKPIVERLGIPTVVITDIDPVRVTKNDSGKTVRKAEVILNSEDLETGNGTLRAWHPKITSLNEYACSNSASNLWVSENNYRVFFAWQRPISKDGPWPSSFEDTFILTNHEWFVNNIDANGAIGSAARTVNKSSDLMELNRDLHSLLRGSFNKGDFATSIFEQLCIGESLKCPIYIFDALEWLQDELQPTNTGGQP